MSLDTINKIFYTINCVLVGVVIGVFILLHKAGIL